MPGRNTCLSLVFFLVAGLALPASTDIEGPARGWLESHRRLEQPYEPLGGPIRFQICQENGNALAALPDYRLLDPDVFGSPLMPRAFGGTSLVCGVPLYLRETQDDQYTRLSEKSSYGNQLVLLRKGRFTLDARDATATDAAQSRDSVQFEASWQDPDGNTYSVECSRVMPHGIEYPVFGGVAANHILNGFTRIGTPLMPTGFAYAAFWGTGQVKKNGQVTDPKVMVHGMLTELVRLDDGTLAFDSQVEPSQRQFHLMVPPFIPSEDNTRYIRKPVNTGYALDNGSQLPFWHVVFSNIEIQSERLLYPPSNGEHDGEQNGNGDGDGEIPARGILTSRAYRPSELVIGMTNSNRFLPDRVRIPVGQTLVWKNTSDKVHTVTANPRKAVNPDSSRLPPEADIFDSGYIQPGQEYRYTFTVPGTYKYFCIPHETDGMVGIVEVGFATQ